MHLPSTDVIHKTVDAAITLERRSYERPGPFRSAQIHIDADDAVDVLKRPGVPGARDNVKAFSHKGVHKSATDSS